MTKKSCVRSSASSCGLETAGDKSEDGSQVNSAKLSQRLRSFLIARVGIGGGQNDAPAGGVETAMSFWQVCALARAHLTDVPQAIHAKQENNAYKGAGFSDCRVGVHTTTPVSAEARSALEFDSGRGTKAMRITCLTA
jgi:hypothetical protein